MVPDQYPFWAEMRPLIEESREVRRNTRLTFAPISPAHSSPMQKLISDAKVAIPAGILHPAPDDFAQSYITKRLEAWQNRKAFTFALLQSGIFIGACSMRAPPQSSYSQHDIDLGINSSAEVSFWLAPETWGLGYASASLGFLSTIAFELFEQDSVWAKCFSWNERCIRTLIRYGFMMQTAVAIDDKKNGEPAKLFFVLSSTPNINETGTW